MERSGIRGLALVDGCTRDFPEPIFRPARVPIARARSGAPLQAGPVGSTRVTGRLRSVQSPMPPKHGIPVEAVGPEPRFVPVEILLADERAVGVVHSCHMD
jgi:hypothetical protein